ncbi:hypothetical protein WEI85_01360 [Actinomycetes bacterium KLBMP 9797]
MATDAEVENLRKRLGPLCGATVAEARLRAMGGSWIVLEMNGFHISIDMAAWRLESSTEFLLACEDHTEIIGKEIAQLRGRRISSVEISKFLDLKLDFEGLVLTAFVASSARVEILHWSVEFDSGETVFVGPGGSWSLRGPQAQG